MDTWTKREDVIIVSAFDEFQHATAVRDPHKQDIQVTMLAKELIHENGNVAYLKRTDLHPCHWPARFLFLYTSVAPSLLCKGPTMSRVI